MKMIKNKQSKKQKIEKIEKIVVIKIKKISKNISFGPFLSKVLDHPSETQVSRSSHSRSSSVSMSSINNTWWFSDEQFAALLTKHRNEEFISPDCENWG